MAFCVDLHTKFLPSINQYCGVMKFLADMPPCLGGGDHGINIA